MTNDLDPPPVSAKFEEILLMMDAMTEKEVIEFASNVNLHIATRFNDTR